MDATRLRAGFRLTCDRQPDPEIYVQRALDSIQEAERLVSQAVRTLAGVPGLKHEATTLADASGRLTRAWYAVRAAANRLLRQNPPLS